MKGKVSCECFWILLVQESRQDINGSVGSAHLQPRVGGGDHPIQVRRLDVRGSHEPEVRVAVVVADDQHDVRPLHGGRRGLAEATGIDDGQLLAWCHRAELLGIRGVGGEYAHLLTMVGVPTLDDLAGCDPEDLLGRLVGENDRRRLVRRLPTDEMIASWVLAAAASERQVEA